MVSYGGSRHNISLLVPQEYRNTTLQLLSEVFLNSGNECLLEEDSAKLMAKAFLKRLDHIHPNPVIAGLVNNIKNYKYSAAKFYVIELDEFEIITHYKGD